jgi:hypothetical protein
MTFRLGTWLQAIKRKEATGAPTRRGANRTRPRRVVLGLEALEDRTVPSTLTVTNSLDTGVIGDGSLRGEIAAASSGDTINFDPSLAGQTIALTGGELALSKSLDIEGLGAGQLTVSGNNASRIFDISAGATVTLAGMTITDGMANGSAPVRTSAGGGILNLGSLTLTNDVVSNNQAVGDPHASALGRVGGAVGGALANLGTLTVSGTTFTGNQALGADGSSGNSAGNAVGGAVFTSGTADITDSQFTFNVAQAGSNCSGNLCATGSSGAIQNSGSLTITGSTFSHNQAIGGNDSSGPVRPGLGTGGAILSGGPTGPAAKLVVTSSTFDHNQAVGGNGNQLVPTSADPLSGPNEAFGGAIHLSAGSATISGCTVEYNSVIGGAGGAHQDGGLAWGGGIDLFNAFGRGVTGTVSNCTISHNSVTGGTGGAGGNGGYAWGGGLANLLGGTLSVSNSTVENNLVIGGAGGSGGDGGDGQGGGIFQDGNVHSTLTLTGDTIDKNHAIGGAAGLGGSDGEGVGGGLYITPGGVAYADALTAIVANHATTSNDDVFGALSFI